MCNTLICDVPIENKWVLCEYVTYKIKELCG